MIPNNPWGWYIVNDPDKVPDLNPHNDDENRGCIATMISAGLAILIYLLTNYGLHKLKSLEIINSDVYFLLIFINIFVFAGILILFMKIGFKIADKIGKKDGTS